jgi:hypothetical protein
VISIDRKKALILLTAVIVTVVMGVIVLNAYSANNGDQSSNGSASWINGRMMNQWGNMPPLIMENRTQGWPHGWGCGRGCYGSVEVSEEFKENATNIAKNDTDVQNLLNDGYNVTGVRPIIKTIVEGDGSVVTKATSAIVVLEKGTTGYASVLVDLEQGKVTKIVILTKTVIEKP